MILTTLVTSLAGALTLRAGDFFCMATPGAVPGSLLASSSRGARFCCCCTFALLGRVEDSLRLLSGTVADSLRPEDDEVDTVAVRSLVHISARHFSQGRAFYDKTLFLWQCWYNACATLFSQRRNYILYYANKKKLHVLKRSATALVWSSRKVLREWKVLSW